MSKYDVLRIPDYLEHILEAIERHRPQDFKLTSSPLLNNRAMSLIVRSAT